MSGSLPLRPGLRPWPGSASQTTWSQPGPDVGRTTLPPNSLLAPGILVALHPASCVPRLGRFCMAWWDLPMATVPGHLVLSESLSSSLLPSGDAETFPGRGPRLNMMGAPALLCKRRGLADPRAPVNRLLPIPLQGVRALRGKQGGVGGPCSEASSTFLLGAVRWSHQSGADSQ